MRISDWSSDVCSSDLSAQRLYDASQAERTIDGERIEDWFMTIVGPLPEDSPVIRDFRAEMARQGMAGESFAMKKGAIPAPRNRRVETAQGKKLTDRKSTRLNSSH